MACFPGTLVADTVSFKIKFCNYLNKHWISLGGLEWSALARSARPRILTPGPELPRAAGPRGAAQPGCGPRLDSSLWFCDFSCPLNSSSCSFLLCEWKCFLITKPVLRPCIRRQRVFGSISKSTFCVCAHVGLDGVLFTFGDELIWVYGALMSRLSLLLTPRT